MFLFFARDGGSQVHYTGLECHPDYDIHMAQASGGGSVVCFRTGSLAFSQHIVTVRYGREETQLFSILLVLGVMYIVSRLWRISSLVDVATKCRCCRKMRTAAHGAFKLG